MLRGTQASPASGHHRLPTPPTPVNSLRTSKTLSRLRSAWLPTSRALNARDFDMARDLQRRTMAAPHGLLLRWRASSACGAHVVDAKGPRVFCPTPGQMSAEARDPFISVWIRSHVGTRVRVRRLPCIQDVNVLIHTLYVCMWSLLCRLTMRST
jgi:hypothetical protein